LIFENLDNSFEKFTLLKDESEDNVSKNTDIFTKSFKPVTSKQKLMVGEINSNVDIFIRDFNNHIFNIFLKKTFERLQILIAEKNEKKNLINKTYTQQIKEMEILLDQGTLQLKFIDNFIFLYPGLDLILFS